MLIMNFDKINGYGRFEELEKKFKTFDDYDRKQKYLEEYVKMSTS